MVLWLIKDGEKCGPFEDYEVREMIRAGKVEGTTRVWHEGAEGWMTAREVAVLSGEFEKKEQLPPPLPLEMPQFRAWRRLGARFFDYVLYSMILNGIFKLMGAKVVMGPDSSGWLVIAILLPAILMEGALVSSFGFTPGKWLLALRVETRLRNKLTTGQGLIRSMRVWILGMGMMLPILMLLGHCISLWFGLKKGGLLWDLQSGFQVSNHRLSQGKIIVYWILLVAVLGGNVALNWSEIWPLIEEELRKQGQLK